ncbi:MAG: hypothetical protein ABJF11_11710 [Reichenbachiella sp.]|uniref:hypothetical protein n=1 Tax=Reichenbachiella sp. TaxID=2184521 RepID=UPI003267FD0D
MKRVSIILALYFVSLISFSACDDKLEEIEVKTPTSEKMTADEDEEKPDPWG